MKSFIILIISLKLVGGILGLACKPHNKTDDLSFINPMTGEPDDMFPINASIGILNRAKVVSCCGTGFNRITWKINGIDVGPADPFTHEFYQDKQRLFYQTMPVGETMFTCTLHSENGESITHTTIVYTTYYPHAKLSIPTFTKIAPDRCAEPGDDVTMHCQLKLSKDDTTFQLLRRVLFKRTEEYRYLGIGANYKWKVHYNQTTNLLDGYGTFTKITEDQLDANYTCQYLANKVVQYTFTISKSPCIGKGGKQPNSVAKVKEIVMILGLTFAVFIVSLILVILVYAFKNRISQTFRIKKIRNKREVDVAVSPPEVETEKV